MNPFQCVVSFNLKCAGRTRDILILEFTGISTTYVQIRETTPEARRRTECPRFDAEARVVFAVLENNVSINEGNVHSKPAWKSNAYLHRIETHMWHARAAN